MDAIKIEHVILVIISVSGTIAGITAAFTISMWNKLRESMIKADSSRPLEAEIARRDSYTARFIIIPHIISIVLLSINTVFGLITFITKIFNSELIFFILLLLFSTALYSLLIPLLIAVKDDVNLIRQHEKMEKEKKERKGNGRKGEEKKD